MMATANMFMVSSLSSFFLFPLFITRHGGGKTDIGILMGAMALSSVLCRPWISQMVDRLGRKKSFALGCLMMASLPWLYLLFKGQLADFYVPLMLVRILHGVGVAVCFTSVYTYIADIIPESRLNEGIGMFGTTGLTGIAAGPVIAEAIINNYGFNAFFMTSSMLGGVAFILQLPLKESFFPADEKESPSFMKVFLMRKIMLVAVLSVLFGVGLAAYSNFVTPYGLEKGLKFISIYYISYSAAAVMTRFLGGRLADRVGEERVIPYALFLTGAGLLMLIFLQGSLLLIISGLVTGCGHGFLFPCLSALGLRDEPVNIRGKISGIFTGSIDAGILAGSVTLGYIGELAGFQAIFLTAGAALIAGLGIMKIGGEAFIRRSRQESG